MALRLITPPAAEPLSLTEVKAHLRVDHTDDDALIALYLTAVRQWIDGKDGWLGRALMPQTWELSLDEFPTAEIRLPLVPVQSVSSVIYDDADGIPQTVDPDDYWLDDVSEPAWIAPVADVSWPTPISAVNAVRVRFVAGYANAASVPFPIKAALLLMVGHLYRNRESVMQEQGKPEVLPMGVDALLSTYRVFL
jgi:uncharacterized phiE125 gp8 family phage protein